MPKISPFSMEKTDVSGRLYRPVFCGKAFTEVFYRIIGSI